MSELLQTGQHPDADQLSAFVEHVLPTHAQEWMLAHLAVCPDCRSVVAVSMPPVEGLSDVQPVPVRRRWFSGWNLLWPAAAAFAALILMVVMARRYGGNSPPTQIAETHLPEKSAVSVGVVPAERGVPERGARRSPVAEGRAINGLRATKSVAGKATPKLTIGAESHANLPGNDLPINGRNLQSLPPSLEAIPQRVMGGMGGGDASPLGQQTQAVGGGVDAQQQTLMSADASAASPSAYAMARPAAAPAATSPSPPPPAAPAEAGRGSATVGGEALDALSDEAVAVQPEPNASAAVISGAALAGLALAGNLAPHPLPSGLPAQSVAKAGQTMLALDSGNALFFSGDGGTHWKRVHAEWHGRVVKVALAVAPIVATPQQVAAVRKAAIRGELQGMVSTATASGAAAQPRAGVSATLTGQVTDPSGAVIPGAMVTLTNAATAASVIATTDQAGSYFAGGLAAGTYLIDATARGFATQELRVKLAASQKAKADLKLQVGQVSETVTLTSATPQLETENSSLSAAVVQPKAKRDAPPVFAITTNTGKRWVSADGQSWKRE